MGSSSIKPRYNMIPTVFHKDRSYKDLCLRVDTIFYHYAGDLEEKVIFR